MLAHLFKRFLLLILLAHCPFVARWCHLDNVADAHILVMATNVTYQDRIAAFGPRLTDEGLFGFLVSVESIDPQNSKGCKELKREKRKILTEDWIALVERGQCTFIDKVRKMQASGAIAVVVGDNLKNGLITMYATGELLKMIWDTSDVEIPSVFIAQTEYKALKSLSTIIEKPVAVQLVKDNFLQPLLDVIIVAIGSPAVMMILIIAVWWWRQQIRRKQDIAPQQVVGNLATKIFFKSKLQENEPQECVICLDDFADEDELRILPCKHEFHKICIDSWLTTRKKFCPICKRDICLPTEETPLL